MRPRFAAWAGRRAAGLRRLTAGAGAFQPVALITFLAWLFTFALAIASPLSSGDPFAYLTGLARR